MTRTIKSLTLLRKLLLWTALLAPCSRMALAADVWTQQPVPDDAAIVAVPVKEARGLQLALPGAARPGLYQVRLTLRASHTADAVALTSGIRVKSEGKLVAEIPGASFARGGQPEQRTAALLLATTGAHTLSLEAYGDAAVLGDVKPLPAAPPENKDDDTTPVGTLSPDRGVYFLLDKAELRLLSATGVVTAVTTDKIRYKPGETIKGAFTLQDVGGKGGKGTVSLFLEHGVHERVAVKQVPVDLGAVAASTNFEIPVPREELGYALVAEFASADGSDRNEAAEYFAVAANFNRVAIFGANPGGTRDVTLEEEPIRKALSSSRADYFNACEYPFWAEDDLLGMSPQSEYWYSGQSNYRMNKSTLQRQIRLAHEQGIAMVSYGKWCVSGPKGWDTVYDRPQDFQGSYNHPIGMWGSVNATVFDRRRNGEQVPYSPRPGGNGPWFDVWWNEFLGITPDYTAANVRRAADETIRSIAMFGWDGIRWDDHPRGAGWAQCGRAGNYQAWAARTTQTLVRYYKDLVAAQYPNFGHGYNYLLIDPKKDTTWAQEDFELDELARGGGLLMNESIGNASDNWTFRSIAQNLQADGDVVRERGGYYLGISFAKSPRDVLVESALWAPAGCRPYNAGMNRETRRYCTRYAQYCFDENLRRIASPEKILAPQAATRLWWQGFVYETPLVAGKRQIVVNLLNVPLDVKRAQRNAPPKPDATLAPGTEPVNFGITLPAGLRASGATLIDPSTLEVTNLSTEGNRLQIPAVAIWKVAVIDLEVSPGAPSLGELFGVPRTVGVLRRDLAATDRRPEVVLSTQEDAVTLEKKLAVLEPDWTVKANAEQAAYEALPAPEQQAALLKVRAAQSADDINKQWWKGGSLPDDLALKDKVKDYGDLTPTRNGRFDIYYARGAMDYRLKMPQVFAGLPRARVTDAPFWGAFRGGSGGMGLGAGLSWTKYPQYDALLFSGVPHSAIGAENCYGMAQYVKAGGGVIFTGGEYAYGKGGYMFTVLERVLLPVLCTEMKDSRTSARPVAMMAGKDFAELNCKVSLAAGPSFWVYNRVLLKDDPSVKVFLTSSKGPVLVGWQVGKGRVVCLLADYRGKSENGTTAFFDWTGWPELCRAVLNWAAPEAGKIAPSRASVQAASAEAVDEAALLADLQDAGVAEPDTQARLYRQVLSIAGARGNILVSEGRKRVSQWNATEKVAFNNWTGGKGFKTDTPELPLLDSETLLQRVAWLAYLSRVDPATYGAQFTREWLMTEVYQDYCGRSQANRKRGDWVRLSQTWGQLRDLTRPDVDALLQKQPGVAAEGLAGAHFSAEVRAAANLLGERDIASTTAILDRLKSAVNPDLAAYARARLTAK